MFEFLAPRDPYDPPSLLYTVLNQPVKLLIYLIDFAISNFRTWPKPGSPPVRIVCISDTHCLTVDSSRIPNGHLLIHAGDLTNAGTPSEIQAQIDWLNSLPHQHKVAIAGNHDTLLDPRSRQTLAPSDKGGAVDWKSIRYLQHSEVTLEFHGGERKLKVFGAPQTACGVDEFAFQYPKGEDAWSETVPDDVDILVTHQPPKYHLDLPSALGSEYLLNEVRRVIPRLHVFGHIHAGKTDMIGWLNGGRQVVKWDEAQKRVERALGGSNGLIRELLDPRSWIAVVKVIVYGALGIVWERVWVGDTPETVMVNASLMYNNTGKLRNMPQVVVV